MKSPKHQSKARKVKMKERNVLVGVTLPHTPNKNRALEQMTCNRQRARWMCSALRKNNHSDREHRHLKQKHEINNIDASSSAGGGDNGGVSSGGGGSGIKGGIKEVLQGNRLNSNSNSKKKKEGSKEHNTSVVLFWEWFRPLLWHAPIDVAAAFTYIETSRYLSKLTAADLCKPISSSHHHWRSRGHSLVLDWVKWSNRVVNWARQVQLYSNDVAGLEFLIDIASHCLHSENFNTVSIVWCPSITIVVTKISVLY